MIHNLSLLESAAALALSITLTAGASACVVEDGGGNDDTGDNGDTSDRGDASSPDSLLRSSGAATDAITLSSELSQLAVAPTFGAAAGDGPGLEARIASVLGEDCATTDASADSVVVTLDCGEVTGRVAITFADPGCLDVEALCTDLDVSVELELDIDGLSIEGQFASAISSDSVTASGSLSISGAGLDLAVEFDLSIADDGACETIDGTMSVDDGLSSVSVQLDGVVDCGDDCPESGRLSASAGGTDVVVDFDAGTVSASDDQGNNVEATLDCSF